MDTDTTLKSILRRLDGRGYKAYIDTLQQVQRIFDMETDPYESENLVTDPELEEILERFRLVLENHPREDGHPRYSKLDSSYYDIPSDKLNERSSRSHRNLQNMVPLATEQEYVVLKK